MTQDQFLILAFKIVLIAGAVSFAAFIAVYTRLAPWWRNQIGFTIVIEAMLLILALVPSILSLFFQFSRLTSHIAAWFDVAIFGSLPAVMTWRTVVWIQIHRQKQAADLAAEAEQLGVRP